MGFVGVECEVCVVVDEVVVVVLVLVVVGYC